jgi:predicted acetyltransferase
MKVGDQVLVFKTKHQGFSRKTGRVIFVSQQCRFVVVELAGLYRETFFIDYFTENNYRIEVVVDEKTDQRPKGINQRNYHRLSALQREIG